MTDKNSWVFKIFAKIFKYMQIISYVLVISFDKIYFFSSNYLLHVFLHDQKFIAHYIYRFSSRKVATAEEATRSSPCIPIWKSMLSSRHVFSPKNHVSSVCLLSNCYLSRPGLFFTSYTRNAQMRTCFPFLSSI